MLPLFVEVDEFDILLQELLYHLGVKSLPGVSGQNSVFHVETHLPQVLLAGQDLSERKELRVKDLVHQQFELLDIGHLRQEAEDGSVGGVREVVRRF